MQMLFYYQDAMVREFSATVVKQGIEKDGRTFIVLDNTAFYPTGGGQPHDTGTLNGITVVNVEKVADEIRHYIAEALPDGVDIVKGVLDWDRRFDHMQQHAGQHILTAAFVELFDYQTVSFHLGRGAVTIDLDVENVSESELVAAEALANKIILENRPIETKWVTEDELAQYNLRKALSVTDEIRLVIIPDFDNNGCGGTHPTSTGQVSAIKIMSIEKQKRKVRVHFLCGGRVLSELHWRKNELSQAAKIANAPENEVANSVTKLLTVQKGLEKALEEAKNQLLACEALDLTEAATDGVTGAIYEERSIQELQKLARIIVAEDANVVALLVGNHGDKLQFVAARGANVDSVSMKDVSTAVLPLLNGKGGGSDAFVQGGGKQTMTGAELLEKMKEVF
ncbi:alanyl-tRNA editing protein [Viridibacillus sp. YIM B01967]|uniref:Alanyl-tRNA editing protein n=1 Tax=Viridibacillus soli TaxID=2798301 RepID=A0ABS1H917_9BACL|nr:DHHA1 domain-containing protein [Viridibacillus soli]MBK3495911.1 alanyl-tRNA editing protein [Viridibacillus soli]